MDKLYSKKGGKQENALTDVFSKKRIEAREELVKEIAKVFSEEFELKNKTSGTLEEIVKDLRNNLPIESKLSNKKNVFEHACKKIGNVLNSYFGNNFIDLEGSRLCEDISEKLYSLTVQINGEYFEALANANTIIKNIYTVIEALKNNFNSFKDGIKTPIAKDFHETSIQILEDLAKNLKVMVGQKMDTDFLKEVQKSESVKKYFKKFTGKYNEGLSKIFNTTYALTSIINKVNELCSKLGISLKDVKKYANSPNPALELAGALSDNLKNTNLSGDFYKAYNELAKILTDHNLVIELNKTGGSTNMLNIHEKAKKHYENKMRLFIEGFNYKLMQIHKHLKDLLDNITTGKISIADVTNTRELKFPEIDNTINYYYYSGAVDSYDEHKIAAITERESYIFKLNDFISNLTEYNKELKLEIINIIINEVKNLINYITETNVAFKNSYIKYGTGSIQNFFNKVGETIESAANIKKGSNEFLNKIHIPNISGEISEIIKLIAHNIKRNKFIEKCKFLKKEYDLDDYTEISARSIAKMKDDLIKIYNETLNKDEIAHEKGYVNKLVYAFKKDSTKGYFFPLDVTHDPKKIKENMDLYFEAAFKAHWNVLELAESLDIYYKNLFNEILEKPENIISILSDLTSDYAFLNKQVDLTTIDFEDKFLISGNFKDFDFNYIYNKLFNYFSTSMNNNGLNGLQNIINIFSKITSKCQYKSSLQIYDIIVDFIIINNIFSESINTSDITIKTGDVAYYELKFSIKNNKSPFDLSLPVLLYNTNTLKSLFTKILGSLIGKIMLLINVNMKLNKPEVSEIRNLLNSTDIVFGGSNFILNTDLLNFYVKIPLLIEFYKEYLNINVFESGDKSPEFIYSDLRIQSPYNQLYKLCYKEKKSLNDVKEIVAICNTLYDMHKNEKNPLQYILNEIIKDVNLKLGFLTFEKDILKLHSYNIHDTELLDNKIIHKQLPSNSYVTLTNKLLNKKNEKLLEFKDNLSVTINNLKKKIKKDIKKVSTEKEYLFSINNYIKQHQNKIVNSNESVKLSILTNLINNPKQKNDNSIKTILNYIISVPQTYFNFYCYLFTNLIYTYNKIFTDFVSVDWNNKMKPNDFTTDFYKNNIIFTNNTVRANIEEIENFLKNNLTDFYNFLYEVLISKKEFKNKANLILEYPENKKLIKFIFDKVDRIIFGSGYKSVHEDFYVNDDLTKFLVFFLNTKNKDLRSFFDDTIKAIIKESRYTSSGGSLSGDIRDLEIYTTTIFFNILYYHCLSKDTPDSFLSKFTVNLNKTNKANMIKIVDGYIDLFMHLAKQAHSLEFGDKIKINITSVDDFYIKHANVIPYFYYFLENNSETKIYGQSIQNIINYTMESMIKIFNHKNIDDLMGFYKNNLKLTDYYLGKEKFNDFKNEVKKQEMVNFFSFREDMGKEINPYDYGMYDDMDDDIDDDIDDDKKDRDSTSQKRDKKISMTDFLKQYEEDIPSTPSSTPSSIIIEDEDSTIKKLISKSSLDNIIIDDLKNVMENKDFEEFLKLMASEADFENFINNKVYAAYIYVLQTLKKNFTILDMNNILTDQDKFVKALTTLKVKNNELLNDTCLNEFKKTFNTGIKDYTEGPLVFVANTTTLDNIIDHILYVESTESWNNASKILLSRYILVGVLTDKDYTKIIPITGETSYINIIKKYPTIVYDYVPKNSFLNKNIFYYWAHKILKLPVLNVDDYNYIYDILFNKIEFNENFIEYKFQIKENNINLSFDDKDITELSKLIMLYVDEEIDMQNIKDQMDDEQFYIKIIKNYFETFEEADLKYKYPNIISFCKKYTNIKSLIKKSKGKKEPRYLMVLQNIIKLIYFDTTKKDVFLNTNKPNKKKENIEGNLYAITLNDALEHLVGDKNTLLNNYESVFNYIKNITLRFSNAYERKAGVFGNLTEEDIKNLLNPLITKIKEHKNIPTKTHLFIEKLESTVSHLYKNLNYVNTKFYELFLKIYYDNFLLEKELQFFTNCQIYNNLFKLMNNLNDIEYLERNDKFHKVHLQLEKALGLLQNVLSLPAEGFAKKIGEVNKSLVDNGVIKSANRMIENENGKDINENKEEKEKKEKEEKEKKSTVIKNFIKYILEEHADKTEEIYKELIMIFKNEITTQITSIDFFEYIRLFNNELFNININDDLLFRFDFSNFQNISLELINNLKQTTDCKDIIGIYENFNQEYKKVPYIDVGNLVKTQNFNNTKTKSYFNNYKINELNLEFSDILYKTLKRLSDKKYEIILGKKIPFRLFYGKIINPLLEDSLLYEFMDKESRITNQNFYKVIQKSVLKINETKGNKKYIEDNYDLLTDFYKKKINLYLGFQLFELKSFLTKVLYYKDIYVNIFKYHKLEMENVEIFQKMINLSNDLINSLSTILNDLNNTSILGQISNYSIKNFKNNYNIDPFYTPYCFLGLLEKKTNFVNTKLLHASKLIFEKDKITTDNILNLNYLISNTFFNEKQYSENSILYYINYTKTLFKQLLNIKNHTSVMFYNNETLLINFYHGEGVMQLYKFNNITNSIIYSLQENIKNNAITEYALNICKNPNVFESVYADNADVSLIDLYKSIGKQVNFNEKIKIDEFCKSSEVDYIILNLLEHNLVPINLRLLYRSSLFSNINILYAVTDLPENSFDDNIINKFSKMLISIKDYLKLSLYTQKPKLKSLELLNTNNLNTKKFNPEIFYKDFL